MAGKQKRKWRKFFIIMYVLAVCSLGTIIYVLPTVSDAFTRTYTVEYGGIQVSSEVECYLVRDEHVYVANRNGQVQYYAEEGKKLRKGAKILDIVSGDPGYSETKYTKLLERIGDQGQMLDSYVSKENGVVSYYLDGYEQMFTPDKLNQLKQKDVSQLTLGVENVTRSTTLKGEPLYKMTNNSSWYAVCWVDAKELVKFQADKNVIISLPKGDVNATIFHISEDDGAWKIILKSNCYYKDLSQIRKTNGTIITEDYKGLVLPNESIASIKGKMGVYVRDVGGDYLFKPVKVITSDGEYSLVQEGYFYENDGKDKVETVDVYDEILRSGKL